MMSVIPSAIVIALLGWWNVSAPQQRPESSSPCTIAGDVVKVSGLREGSGVAASRRTPGVLWAHNDSAEPVIVALNEQGAVNGRVRIAGAQVDDWEDIAVGACPGGSCLYIGDIGDNQGKRNHVTIYRVPEPAPNEKTTRPAESFHGKYPDGVHDAEALFVTAESDVFIITNGDPGPIALYRFPRPLGAGAVMPLERVGAPRGAGKVDPDDRVTAADISSDGQWVAVRTTRYVAFYRAADLLAGRWKEAFRTDLGRLREPRGEGITFGRDGTVFLVGEGERAGDSGTFARLACKFSR
jgi:hypothetical protein